MKLSKIILSSDSNLFYLGCWSIALQVWKKAFGITPTLVFISNDITLFNQLKKTSKDIILLKPESNVDIGIQAKISRMYIASQFPCETILLGDIDIIPLNIEQLKNKITNTSEEYLTSCGGNAYENTDDQGKFPMSLLTGKGSVFQKIVNPRNLEYKDLLNEWGNIVNPIDGKESVFQPFHKFSDESLLRYLVKDVKVIDCPRPLNCTDSITKKESGLFKYMPTFSDRIDRLDDKYIVIPKNKMSLLEYTDIHLCRPIEKHLNQYKKIFQLLDVDLNIPHFLLKTDYVTGNGFKEMCDHVIDTWVFKKSIDVKENDLVFVQTDFLEFFFQHIYDNIKNPFILISHNSESSAPGSFVKYLNESKIKVWFGHNCDYSHPKFIPIPIGIANFGQNNSNQWLLEEIAQKPNVDRIPKVLVNFNNSSFGMKHDIFNCLSEKPCVDVLNNEEYLDNLKKYKFIASPRGKGIDSHRTWEALLMGCIPIISSYEMSSLYSDLNVLVIEDWDEIEGVLKNYNQSNDGSREKLSISFWKNLIYNYK